MDGKKDGLVQKVAAEDLDGDARLEAPSKDAAQVEAELDGEIQVRLLGSEEGQRGLQTVVVIPPPFRSVVTQTSGPIP